MVSLSNKDVGIPKTGIVPGDLKGQDVDGERKEKKKQIMNPHLNGEATIPYLRESVWFLYSSIVFGGRFKTRRSVSRIRLVVA